MSVVFGLLLDIVGLKVTNWRFWVLNVFVNFWVSLALSV